MRNLVILLLFPVSYRKNFRRMGSVLCQKRSGKLGIQLVYRTYELLDDAAFVLAGRIGELVFADIVIFISFFPSQCHAYCTKRSSGVSLCCDGFSASNA